jgi:hypothetical protein
MHPFIYSNSPDQAGAAVTGGYCLFRHATAGLCPAYEFVYYEASICFVMFDFCD